MLGKSKRNLALKQHPLKAVEQLGAGGRGLSGPTSFAPLIYKARGMATMWCFVWATSPCKANAQEIPCWMHGLLALFGSVVSCLEPCLQPTYPLLKMFISCCCKARTMCTLVRAVGNRSRPSSNLTAAPSPPPTNHHALGPIHGTRTPKTSRVL